MTDDYELPTGSDAAKVLADTNGDAVIARLLSKPPVTKTVPIVLDPDASDAWAEIAADLQAAEIRARHDPDDGEAAAALTAAQQRHDEVRDGLLADGKVQVFTFRAIGSAAFDALVMDHPSTAEQRARALRLGAEAEPAWDTDKFPPALVAASLADPPLTPEQVDVLFTSSTWNQAELGTLFAVALEVNTARRSIGDVGKDFAATGPSGPKSSGARRTASRTRSS